MTSLFDYADSYPSSPGYRENDTSRAAAESMKPTAAYLQSKCLKALAKGPMTADEVADDIGETPFATRPRLTELKLAGRIVDDGTRRRNASGRSAKCWRLA